MTKSLSVLGSTGSIGRRAVDVVRRLGIPIAALTTNTNIILLEEQARTLKPRFVAAYSPEAAQALRDRLSGTGIAVGSGMEGLLTAAVMEGADTVLTAVSGSVGLRPTAAALEAGKRIALANKESLVCAGRLLTGLAARHDTSIIPVDSEHSAIYQCLRSGERAELQRILLTASGGPFRGRKWEELRDVTPEEALRHPRWDMGPKISIDSATMMNKGLEYIEAIHLFGADPGQIEILIHPESIVHSMVEFRDGAVVAQLGIPDMRLPIQYALTCPDRLPTSLPGLDLFTNSVLTFYQPDLPELPCLAAAMECARIGGTATAVMNAANEAAVELFLRGEIRYTRIYECIVSALDSMVLRDDTELEVILEADAEARSHVLNRFGT